MHVSVSLAIAAPLELVWAKFIDPANLPHWQPTLQAVELLHGTAMQPGAESRLTYREGRMTVVMHETVLERTELQSYRCTYNSPMMQSTISNTFVHITPQQTRWTMVQQTAFHGFWRLVGPLMRPITVSKFRTDMARFQALVEHANLGTHA